MFLWLIVIFFVTLFSFLMVGLGFFFSKKTFLPLAYSSPFECGFTPLSEKTPPISIHFFIVMLIFLIFDVELILLFPYFLALPLSSTTSFLVLVVVLNTLSLGLFYEWATSMLEWLS